MYANLGKKKEERKGGDPFILSDRYRIEKREKGDLRSAHLPIDIRGKGGFAYISAVQEGREGPALIAVSPGKKEGGGGGGAA